MKLINSILIVTFTLILPSCDKGMEKKNIIGTWKIIEYADFDTVRNQWYYPYGKIPRGFYTYTSNNIFTINISNQEPLSLEEDSVRTKKFVYEDFLYNAAGYFGKYNISFEDSVLTYSVEGGAVPFFIGTKQQKPFSLHGDTLIIGDNVTWKRVLIKID